jgi:hypothetical protein
MLSFQNDVTKRKNPAHPLVDGGVIFWQTCGVGRKEGRFPYPFIWPKEGELRFVFRMSFYLFGSNKPQLMIATA